LKEIGFIITAMTQPNPHFLSQSERDSLKALHRKERDKKICDRVKAILLLDNGWSYDKIATALLLDSDTIRRYYTMYIDGGKEALLSLSYSGRSSQLNQDQLDQLKSYVKDKSPTSSLEVATFVKQQFSLEYTTSGIVALLHRLGFVYKKPKLIPGKANAEEQEQFIEELQQIKAELKPEDEIIYMDGVHPQHNSKPAYGWFEKGVEATLKANSGRKRININGALNIDNLNVIINSADSVNAQSTIELFKKLELQYPDANRIVVVCDNARYYKSEMVSEYLKHSKIELKFLPPYSPNLNLIERLWKFMNKKIRNNKYYEKFTDFREATFAFFENLSIYKEELNRLLSQKFHIIKS
jgi:transposase